MKYFYVCMSVCMFACPCVCCMSMCILICPCVCCMCVCVHMFTCPCMCMCVFADIHPDCKCIHTYGMYCYWRKVSVCLCYHSLLSCSLSTWCRYAIPIIQKILEHKLVSFMYFDLVYLYFDFLYLHFDFLYLCFDFLYLYFDFLYLYFDLVYPHFVPTGVYCCHVCVFADTDIWYDCHTLCRVWLRVRAQ